MGAGNVSNSTVYGDVVEYHGPVTSTFTPPCRTCYEYIISQSKETQAWGRINYTVRYEEEQKEGRTTVLLLYGGVWPWFEDILLSSSTSNKNKTALCAEYQALPWFRSHITSHIASAGHHCCHFTNEDETEILLNECYHLKCVSPSSS